MTASYNLSLLGSNYNQGGTGAVARTTASKLQDSVSVKDFGAVGDGTTDDAAAIQAAINTGKQVFLPAGKYLVKSALTLNNNFTSSTDPFAPTQFDSGLVMLGEGINKTQILCGFSAPALTGATAQGVINLPATVTGKYRLGTIVAELSIFPSGSITNTHGILMNANWYAEFNSVRVKGMPGNGFYSPLRTDLSAISDDYQNTVVKFDHCIFDGNYYGWYGESGLGCAATHLTGCLITNNSKSGVRISGVLGLIENCSIGANGNSGTLAGIDTCGIIIDVANAGAQSRNFAVKECEFESNYHANLWVRSCFGFVSENLRLNSQISLSPPSTANLTANIQVLLGDTGGSIRSAKFTGDVSKSPPTWAASLSMYQIYGADTAQVEIYNPYGSASVDNVSGFIVLDTSITTGALDGVRLLNNGIIKQSRSWSHTPLAQGYWASNLTIANNTPTTLVTDTENIDNTNSLSAGIFTVPTVGNYRVAASIQVQAIAAAVQVYLRIRRSGGTIAQRNYTSTGAAYETFTISEIINCPNSTDTLSVEVSQLTGGNMTITGGAAVGGLSFNLIP